MNIILFPNPILRDKSEKVKNITNKEIEISYKLKNIMYSNKGCVGIASPQIGKLKQIIVVDVSKHKKTTKVHGFITMFNPEILQKEGKTINREGCLSVPDFTGNVERSNFIKVKYIDLNGNEKIIETEGFEAVVIQHEIDHLNGILFIDRIKNTKRDLFKRKKY